MHIQTILNRVQKHKGFVYGEAKLLKEKKETVLEVSVRAWKGSRGKCSQCGRKAAGYDVLAPRRFEFIPFWGILVVFVYAMRRVQCPRCSVKVEQVPWAVGKSPTTWAYAWFLAGWAKRLAWSQVAETFHDLLRYNLKTVRAYLLKEEFQQFWDYVSPHWAGQFLDHWCGMALRSRIEPVKAVARMLRSHRPLILNWFRAKKEFSCGVVEGLNNKAKLTTRKAYGYAHFKTLEIALYHTLGDLPEPKFTHRFF